MEFLEMFKEKVLNTTDSFTIEYNRYEYAFIQARVGKARCVYSSYEINTSFVDLQKKFELVAIVLDSNIYVINYYILSDYVYRIDSKPHPANIYYLYEIMEKANTYVKNTIFKEFYNALEPDVIIEDSEIVSCKRRARNILLTQQGDIEIKFESFFNEQEIINMICGFTNIDEEARKKLGIQEDRWAKIKFINETIKNFMEDSSVVFDWEKKITNILNNINAKSITIEFERNGKKAMAKINPEIVLRILINNSYFSDYHFIKQKEGKKLLEELGASDPFYDSENRLMCKHINRILYRGKTIYARQE